MRLDAASESRFMEYSRKLDLPFGSVILGYVLEGTLYQIAESSFGNVLWLANQKYLGREAYEQNRPGRLEFYYIEYTKGMSEERMVPGQKLSEKLMSIMAQEFFPEKNRWGITWTYDHCRVHQREGSMQVSARVEELEVPVELRFHRMSQGLMPQRSRIASILDERKEISFLTYSADDILASNLIEILTKLELIGDMEPYAQANDILREQSVSGRNVVSILEDHAQLEPTFRKEKRMEQFRGYRSYSYMRKRWDKYQKHQVRERESWGDVMDRLLNFTEPIWQAFMNNDIFLDDWMPELGRFLG